MVDGLSTISPLRGGGGSARFERVLELSAHVILIAIVLGAALGLAGVSTTTARAEAGGLEFCVTHARTTRAGLATPFSIRVAARAGVLPAHVTLRVDSDYLALFDRNGVDPYPDRTHVGEADTAFSFDVPAGESSIEVVFDVRTEPAARWGRSAVIRLDGGPSVTIRTNVVP